MAKAPTSSFFDPGGLFMKDEVSEVAKYGFFPSSRMVSFADTVVVDVQPASNIPTAPRQPVTRQSSQPSIDPSSVYRHFVKRFLDIAFVLLTLPFSLPLIGFFALTLWFEGGKPFYTQARLGAGGKKFSIFKLRTMVDNADQVLEAYLARDPKMRREWDTLQKLNNDPRVTPVGKILRVTSLDELPQLFNVLRGDMSVVGPRPMMPEQLEMYGDPDAYFALKPGITGLWQVSARNSARFSYRNEVDAEYERTVSLGADLKILFKTVGVVLRPTGR